MKSTIVYTIGLVNLGSSLFVKLFVINFSCLAIINKWFDMAFT